MNKVSVAVPVYNVENYIYDMLKSVQNQTFKDFEVVIIDDGSTDSSGQIAKEFCASDVRFKYFRQENGGVASARNKAIDLASGEYIVFYDPDDYIPPHALEKMYKAAISGAADMVVGVMEEKNLGESLIYMHSQKLAKQKNISPADPHFIGAWSLCHKMFSMRLIREHDLRFEQLYNAEDGVFTYRALNCAEVISGCDTIAYNYIKRPFWLTPSATQIISRRYLKSLLASHDRIREEAEKLIQKYLTEEEQADYLGKLYYRFIEGEMINGYYRGMWRGEEDLSEILNQRTKLYRSYLSDKQWSSLLAGHRDLNLESGFMSPEEMDREPVVSVILTPDYTAEEVDMMLGSVYNQAFPRFEILLPASFDGAAGQAYRNKVNLKIIEGDIAAEFLNRAVKQARGRYIIIFDEFAMFTKNSLRLMASKLSSRAGLGFVSMVMKNFDGSSYKPIPVISAAFGYTKRGRRKYGKIASCDNIFSNKLFRKSSLEGFRFSGRGPHDVDTLYRTLSFERLRKGAMITDMEDEDFLARAETSPPAILVKCRHSQNSRADRLIQRLKRHITREDIENLKSKIGK